MELPSPEVIDAEVGRRSFAEFVRQYWHVVEPQTPLVWGWHLELICDRLQAVADGQCRQLLINIPPGHCKSLLVSVLWPAWVWTRRPGWRAVFASYAHSLASRDSVRCRSVIESDRYRAAYPEVRLRDDQNAKDSFSNTLAGTRHCTSVGGSSTGWRGDAVVVDDPLNAIDATSTLARKTALDWWDQAMTSRLNNQRTGSRVIIMQRLHEEDLSGHLLRQGGWEHLCLPTEFDPGRRCAGDPRTVAGELLFPEMFPRDVVDRTKIELGSAGFSGQHQQTPVTDGGNMFQRKWWKTYSKLPHCPEWAASVDCTFKDSRNSDYVVAQVWARRGASCFLVWQSRGRRSFTETCELIRRMKGLYPQVGPVLIEDKANGPAVLDALRDVVPGLIAVNPGASKEARAAAVTPLIEAGNVFLPESPSAWDGDSSLSGFIDELAMFPRGRHDDQTDTLTQMLNRWRVPAATRFRVMPLPAPRAKEEL